MSRVELSKKRVTDIQIYGPIPHKETLGRLDVKTDCVIRVFIREILKVFVHFVISANKYIVILVTLQAFANRLRELYDNKIESKRENQNFPD